MDAAHYTPPELPVEELAESDRVFGALTEATRAFALAQLQTRVDRAEAEAVTAELERLTARLRAVSKPGSFGTELVPGDDRPRNHGNAVVGLRNPIARLALADRIVWTENGATASFHLNALYEGPPGLVHGGVSALLLDQLLGEAAASGGNPGMTARFELQYRRPTPLGDLSMEGWVISSDDTKTVARGHLQDPDGNVTVEAEALFVVPRWARGREGWAGAKRVFE